MEDNLSLVDRYSRLFKIIDDENLLREHFSAHVGQGVWIAAKSCSDKENAKELRKLAEMILPTPNQECKSLDDLEQEGFDEEKFYKKLKELLS